MLSEVFQVWRHGEGSSPTSLEVCLQNSKHFESTWLSQRSTSASPVPRSCPSFTYQELHLQHTIILATLVLVINQPFCHLSHILLFCPGCLPSTLPRWLPRCSVHTQITGPKNTTQRRLPKDNYSKLLKATFPSTYHLISSSAAITNLGRWRSTGKTSS